MEIHQLKTFVAVAREGSITRASERLYLSQPAVSAHIKAIEETLGVALFERTPKGMSLTRDGERLLEKAEATLTAHRAMIDEASAMKGSLRGTLRLGVASGASAEALGRLLTALSDRFPEVETALAHGATPDILDRLRSGALDACFYNEADAPDADLAAVEVARFGVHLAAPKGLVNRIGPLDWTALAQLSWIVPSTSACCGRVAEALFETHGFRPERIIAIDREDVMRTMISGGVGVGLLHSTAIEEATRQGHIEILCEAQPTVQVLFAHLTRRANEPLLAAATEILRETQAA